MKKKQETNYSGWDSFNCLRKTLKIMKISTLLMFIGLCNISATVFPQSSKIDLSLQNVSLKEAFENIEKVSGYKFLYRSDLVNINSVTSIETNGSSLEKLLDKLFANTDIRYNILNDNLVVLTPMQKQKVTGTVIDATSGDPIPGVNVSIDGTTIGTITDESGKYTLDLPSENSVLVFSFVGYATQKVEYKGQESISISLAEDVKSLDEIVVVGYGVQKRSSVTGAISPLSGKELRQLAVSNVQSALQGQAAGVSVVNNGGPGTDPIVRIRGNGSITYAADPLYVIDGTPASSLASFDSRDIESVEVLKDASSTAIYGSRAANGVVLITTKKGKKGEKVRINFDTYVGVQTMPKKLDLLNTEQYIQYGTELLTNAGKASDIPKRFAQLDQPIYEGASTTYRQTNTDWQDEVFQKAMMNDNNLSFSTGGEKSTYYGSVGYCKFDGIMVGTGYERYSLRLNSEHDLSKVFKFGQTLAFSYGDRDNKFETQGRPNIMHMIRSAPYMPVTVPEGVIADDKKILGGYRAANSAIDGQDADNPVKVQKLFNSTTGTTKLFGTLYLDVKLFEFLKFRSTFGLDYENLLNSVNQPIYNDGFNQLSAGVVRRERFENVTKMFSNQLTFDKKMGNHYLNVIAVYEQTPYTQIAMYTTGNLATNAVKEMTGMTNINANGSKNQNTLVSYLGRLNYDFKGRYLLSVSMRADGSSKFASGNKWGYFPSASLGWRVTEEEFMKGIEDISELKVRVGYGELGNNGGIGNYAWKAVINSNTDYIFNNAVANGSYYNGLDNPDLKWETSKMTNVGIDLGLFKNKITFTAEYFKKITDNLILNVPYAYSIGYNAAYPANIGKMENHGFEFAVTGQINAGELKSSLSANISFIRNEVTKLSTPQSAIDNGFNQDYGAYSTTRTVEGRAIQSFYGWETDGIFQSAEEVASSPTQVVTMKDGKLDPTASTAPGDIKFKDQNNDGVINSDDRVFLGSYLPKFSYGFTYNGTYKNLDFGLMFQGVYGNKIYNANKVITQGMLRLFNASTDVLDAWTPENPNTDIPRAITGDPNQNARTSDRFIEDGSYLRLKALTIGYSIPVKTLQSVTKGTVAGFRIYVTGQNLLTFTKYTGYDPEVGAYIPLSGNSTPGTASSNGNNGGLLNNGVDYDTMPQPRTFIAGIQLTF
jgi:TonB-linked SusC/RagA family outer membrane protein